MSDMPWKDAILHVLKREGSAMHYTDIAERIVENRLRESVGATPASTVAAVISMSLNNEDEDSPFLRVRRGEYILRELARDDVEAGQPGDETESTDEEDQYVIQALGMFWDRDSVLWTSDPRILGRQQIGADHVDMGDQRGVYLLHDTRDVIYIGRTTQRSLGQRLYEHTYDRLNPDPAAEGR